MTKRVLFEALCDVANAVQAEVERLRFSPHKLALETIREHLDQVIDQVLEEGVTEQGEDAADA